MYEVSKEELSAFTESNTKSAIALERVTDALELIIQKQDKLFDKMTNGVSETIIKGIITNYDNTHKETVASLDRLEGKSKEILEALEDRIPLTFEEKLKNSSISRDIEHVKWLVSIVGIVVIIAMVILRIMGGDLSSKDTPTTQRLLQEHINQTESRTIVK